MNNIRVKIYKKVPKEVTQYNGAEDFINNGTDDICFQEKLSDEEVIYFVIGFLQFMFP